MKESTHRLLKQNVSMVLPKEYTVLITKRLFFKSTVGTKEQNQKTKQKPHITSYSINMNTFDNKSSPTASVKYEHIV